VRLDLKVEICKLSSLRCLFYEMIASENWEFDDFNTYETLGLVGEESEMNIRKSVTQFSSATIRQEGDYKVFVSNFSFPFDY